MNSVLVAIIAIARQRAAALRTACLNEGACSSGAALLHRDETAPVRSVVRARRRGELALTKMNWNSTQFDGSLPITLRASRAVSRILKHVSAGALEAPESRFYQSAEGARLSSIPFVLPSAPDWKGIARGRDDSRLDLGDDHFVDSWFRVPV
jgi:hypothetical protein